MYLISCYDSDTVKEESVKLFEKVIYLDSITYSKSYQYEGCVDIPANGFHGLCVLSI